MKTSDLKNIFPNANCKGNKEIIENLLPKDFYLFHIDSHNTPKGFRFQGCVLYGDNKEDSVVCLEMPLEVLKAAKNYRIIKNTNFLVWTVWFDNPEENRKAIANRIKELENEIIQNIHMHNDAYFENLELEQEIEHLKTKL